MTAIDDLVGRYVAVWSEQDEGSRARMVTELWTDDAVHVLESREVHGHEAIEERIADAYGSLVEEQGFAFHQVGNVGAHHDAVTFEIHMAPAGGGAVAWVGRMVLLLDGDGRIARDYQFGWNVPA